MKKILIFSLLVVTCNSLANNEQLVSNNPNTGIANYSAPNIQEEAEKLWSIMFYAGETSGQDFLEVVQFHFSGIDETLFSTELAYSLSKNNFIEKYIYPYAQLQFAVNLGQRTSESDPTPVGEGDLYMVLRWQAFPWNNYVKTSFAVGEGVSYVSHVPIGEIEDPELKPGDVTRKLLNYLMLELTVSIPKHPDVQLVYRLHHRCTAYGMYGNEKQGSTNVGLGLRFLF